MFYKEAKVKFDEDEAFRYNAESALVFYRVKSYDVASFISSDV